MPRLVHEYPRYRFHKASGQAVETLNGKDYSRPTWYQGEQGRV
ncbi:MAG: hypothetical protein ACLQU5_36840 [Isosphaeraceae bacterium]